MGNTKSKLESTTDVHFEKDVLKSDLPVLLDFWAPWCGPCVMMGPQLEEVAQTMSGKIKVLKLNVDENPATATTYGIMGIPSLLIFKEGKEVKRLVGLQTAEALAREIEATL